MRRRPWLSLLAAFSVLLHVGIAARHNGGMLDARAQIDPLHLDLADICRGGLGSQWGPASDLPQAPDPSGAQGICPSCCVLAGALILAGETEVLPPPTRGIAHRFDLGAATATQASTLWPPARGPPSVS